MHIRHSHLFVSYHLDPARLDALPVPQTMIQPGIEDDSTTSSLYRLTRDWIEHLRSVLYHARVIKTSPLGDDHPLSEDFPFVRKPVSQTFTRFYTRTHFDTQPPLQQGEETSYPVSLVYTPGREEYNASWTITSGMLWIV